MVVNGARREEDTDLSCLQRDLNCPDPDRMHFKVLADTVRYYKNTDEGGEEVDEFLKKIQDEGREIGREETLRSFVFKLLAKGFPFETISELASVSLAEVQALAAEAPPGQS